jgi:hypothetical protein
VFDDVKGWFIILFCRFLRQFCFVFLFVSDPILLNWGVFFNLVKRKRLSSNNGLSCWEKGGVRGGERGS